MRAFLLRLFSRWYGFQEPSGLWFAEQTQKEALEQLLAMPVDHADLSKRGHRVIHAEPDRSKTGNTDILGLVLQREAEAKRQPGNVKRFVRNVK